MQSLADRVLSRPITVGQGLVDNRDRPRTVIVNAGRTHTADTTTLHFATGKKLRIWAEILTDYRPRVLAEGLGVSPNSMERNHFPNSVWLETR